MRTLSITVITTEDNGGNRILASEFKEPWDNTARPTGQELPVWTCNSYPFKLQDTDSSEILYRLYNLPLHGLL